MPEDYGVQQAAESSTTLLGGHPPVMKPATLASGEVAAAGQVLAQNTAGKCVTLDLETEVADEELVADAGGATKVFEGHLANGGVIPGTVTIAATVGAAAANMADDGAGALAGAGVGLGFVDYTSGYYRLVYGTAPDDDTAIEASYSHDGAGQAVAATVALEAKDATDSDEPVITLAHGEVMADALVWPDGISAGQKARALTALAAAGIHATETVGL